MAMFIQLPTRPDLTRVRTFAWGDMDSPLAVAFSGGVWQDDPKFDFSDWYSWCWPNWICYAWPDHYHRMLDSSLMNAIVAPVCALLACSALYEALPMPGHAMFPHVANMRFGYPHFGGLE